MNRSSYYDWANQKTPSVGANMGLLGEAGIAASDADADAIAGGLDSGFYQTRQMRFLGPARMGGFVGIKSTNIQLLNYADIHFSQTSVNNVDSIVNSMKLNGWQGAPVDVIRLFNGKSNCR